MASKTNIFDDVITNLSSASDSEATEYAMVSTKKKIKLKPITLGQQRDLLSDVLSASETRLDINTRLNKIITDNNTSDIPVHIIDRDYLLLQMKREITGDNLNVFVGEEPHVINLSKHFAECEKANKKVKIENEFTCEADSVKAHCAIPTIGRDSEIIEYNQTRYNQLYQNGIAESEAEKQAIAIAYLGEIVKYVKSIEVADNTVVFNDLTLDQQYVVMESVPFSVSKKISKTITEALSQIIHITVSEQIENTPVNIEITAQLFSNE